MADTHPVFARIRQMVNAWEQQLPETIRTATAADAIRATLDRAAAPIPGPPPIRPAAPALAADGLVPHGEPIDIGWIGGSLDARLRLTVRPGMDEAERDQSLADLRDALAPVVPIRRTGREVSS